MREQIRALLAQKRLPQAVAAAQRLVLLQTRLLGAAHERTGVALGELGELQRLSGSPEQALESLRLALDIIERDPARNAASLWSVLRSLESIYVPRRDTAHLLPVYERQLVLVPTVFGSNTEKLGDVLGSLAWVHHAQGHEEAAVSYSRRAVAAQRLAKGDRDPSVAELLMSFSELYAEMRDEDAAIGALREAAAIFEEAPGAGAREYAGCLNQLATLLINRSDYAQAEPVLLRAATQYERLPGTASVGAAFAWANAAMLREQQRDYRGAEALLVLARAKFESTVGPSDPRSAVVLSHLAALYAGRSAYVDAEETYRRLIALHEHAKDSASLAIAFHDLANMQLNRGRFEAAADAFARALKVLEEGGQLESAHGVKLLSSFASYCLVRGDLPRARSMAERALSIAESGLEPSARERGYAAVALARIHTELGDNRKAEALYLQAERVWRAAGGDDAPELALSHNNLAALHHRQGHYRRAEQLLLESLKISQKAGERGAHNALAAMSGLSALYSEQGEPQRAMPYAEETLQAWERAGAELPGTALAHANLGRIYVGRRDFTRAQPHLERALAINRRNSDRMAAAEVLADIAGLRNLKDDWPGAEVAYREAIEQLKPFSSVTAKLATARALAGLASLRLARGDMEEAEVLTRQALDAANVAGAGSPVAIAAALGIAQLLTIKEDFAGAEILLQRTEQALESAAGKEHPRLPNVLFGKALVQWSRANPAAAFQTFAEGLDLQERQLTRTLSIGSEAQRGLVLSGFDLGGEPAVSLHAGAYRAEPTAMRLAMLSILRRKGRLLDTVATTNQVLRAHLSPPDAALLDALGKLREAIAARAMASDTGGGVGRAPAEDISELSQRADALEARIASRSAYFQAAVQSVTLESVAAAIPTDAVLVEIASYRPPNRTSARVDQMWGERRYVAYALAHSGALRYVDLGRAQAIEEAVFSFRAALSGPGSDARPAGRSLDELVMRPIRGIVGDVRRLLVAPDGVLNVVPFGALVDEQGRYLIEQWRLSYVSTGRDLVRRRDTAPRSGDMVIAHPAFGGSEDSSGEVGNHVYPLPFTEDEGREVAAALGSREPWLGARATKRALMQARGPRVLHIATHGFFLDDVQAPSASMRGFLRATPAEKSQNPLLRSGLALAGANLAGGEGILTSLEASSLDLWGTRLVVLSACDTGMGEVKSGEGVYGLRRAFAVAGAESIVMSLWSVQDEATRELMKAYYTRLARGEGRADALRNAQLSLSRRPRFSSPWHWASFVHYGDGSPLGAPAPRQAAPGPPPVQASSGRLGCGCRTAGSGRRQAATPLPALLGGALLMLRRKKAAGLGRRRRA